MFSFGKPINVPGLGTNFFHDIEEVDDHAKRVFDKTCQSAPLELLVKEMFGFGTCVGTDLYQCTQTLASSSVGAIIFRALLYVIVWLRFKLFLTLAWRSAGE